jgi:uncharacterized membrane protein YhfC
MCTQEGMTAHTMSSHVLFVMVTVARISWCPVTYHMSFMGQLTFFFFTKLCHFVLINMNLKRKQNRFPY